MKLSPYIVTADRPIITAWTTLMSASTGQPLALCDAGLLTVERTAGTTALAVAELAPKGARRLAIIGSGRIAEAHWRLVAGLRDWEAVRVWSPRLHQKASSGTGWASADPRLQIADSATDACGDAEVVMLCTSSGTPVIETKALRPGVLVTSISTNVAQAHEVEPGFLAHARSIATTGRPRRAPPARWYWRRARQLVCRQDHGRSGELVAGRCPRPSGNAPVFFRSIGLGSKTSRWRRRSCVHRKR